MAGVGRRGRPPGVRLVIGENTVDGVEGSSIWQGIADDRLVAVPEVWTPVYRGDPARFDADGPQPEEGFLTVYPETSVAERSMRALTGFELDPAKPVWSVDQPPGRYVVTFSRSWEGGESVVHSFGVEVRDRSDD